MKVIIIKTNIIYKTNIYVPLGRQILINITHFNKINFYSPCSYTFRIYLPKSQIIHKTLENVVPSYKHWNRVPKCWYFTVYFFSKRKNTTLCSIFWTNVCFHFAMMLQVFTLTYRFVLLLLISPILCSE